MLFRTWFLNMRYAYQCLLVRGQKKSKYKKDSNLKNTQNTKHIYLAVSTIDGNIM
jgi:hypothetical protein